MHPEVRLIQIDERMKALKHLIEGLMPVYMQVDRKIKALELEISLLEEERESISQGQLELGSTDF